MTPGRLTIIFKRRQLFLSRTSSHDRNKRDETPTVPRMRIRRFRFVLLDSLVRFVMPPMPAKRIRLDLS